MTKISDPPRSESILAHFEQVRHERGQRLVIPKLMEATAAVKCFQDLRFRETYADLFESDRYSAASNYFLEELYGPQDFAMRDMQFERVIPALVRLFPEPIIGAVECMAELHSLSEQLDTAMGRHLLEQPPQFSLHLDQYRLVWRATGCRDARLRQLSLTVELGKRLDKLTRNPIFRSALRLMRGPAKGAGLSVLQNMLERGFDTFHAMGGATEFLDIISARESQLIEILFSPGA
jgi:hypothetical protein